MADLRQIKPGGLRLPPEREDGADQFKLSRQIQEFGETLIACYGKVDRLVPTVRSPRLSCRCGCILKVSRYEQHDMRFGQMLASLALFARGPLKSATWDVEDEELLKAAQRHLQNLRQQRDAKQEVKELTTAQAMKSAA